MVKSRRRKAMSRASSALLTCVLTIVVCVAAIPARAGDTVTVATETILLPHLQQPVQILIDHWGGSAHLRQQRG
jgi:hypothetical protein